MTKLADLPTLAQARSRPPNLAKPRARIEDSRQRLRETQRKGAAFRKAIWVRDGNRCRLCGIWVIHSLALVPNRGEIHHVRGRNVAPEDLYNPKAALLTCAICHQRTQRHEVRVPQP